MSHRATDWTVAEREPNQWVRLRSDGTFVLMRPSAGQTLKRGQKDRVSRIALGEDAESGETWWAEKSASGELVLTLGDEVAIRELRFRYNSTTSSWESYRFLDVQASTSPVKKLADVQSDAGDATPSFVGQWYRKLMRFLYRKLGGEDHWELLGTFTRMRELGCDARSPELVLDRNNLSGFIFDYRGVVYLNKEKYLPFQTIDTSRTFGRVKWWIYRKPGRFRKLYVLEIHDTTITDVDVYTFENGIWWQWERVSEGTLSRNTSLMGKRLSRLSLFLVVLWLLICYAAWDFIGDLVRLSE